jgi:hypothetical protein
MTTEPYRIALETALAEITEITTKIEQLSVRRGHVKTLIATLQPMFAADSDQAEGFAADQTPEPEGKSGVGTGEAFLESDGPAEYSYLQVPAPLPESDGSPFERRVKATFRFKGLATQR